MIRIEVTDRDGNPHSVEGRVNDRLMEVLREFDWGVAAICGGMCSCGTCHVFVAEAWLDRFPPPDSDETDLLEFLEHYKPNSRLSCQLELGEKHDGLTVTLAPEE